MNASWSNERSQWRYEMTVPPWAIRAAHAAAAVGRAAELAREGAVECRRGLNLKRTGLAQDV
jgi:hypothetical protein